MKPFSFSLRATLLLSFVGLSLNLTGCVLGTSSESGPVEGGPVPLQAMQGGVHGGQQPIVGATIQLYAAGAPATGGGYGAGATALIPTGSYSAGGASGCVPSTNPVVTCTTLPTTDSNGLFNISNEYSCPSANSLVYIVATGGDPGGGANSFVSLASLLGTCNSTNTSGNPSISSTAFVNVDEVSTVGVAYALQQFLSAPAANTVENIGAPGTTYNSVQTAVVGLQNAFTMFTNLVNVPAGTSPGTNANAIVENTQLNTVADILAYCINSASTDISSHCGTLMTDATPSGGTTATDTFQAAYYIVHNPYHNVATLFGLIAGTGPPFTPPAAAPDDFTLAVQYLPTYNNGTTTVPALGRATYVAIDAYGNGWFIQSGQTVTNQNGGTATAVAGVVGIGANGTTILNPLNTYTDATGTAGAYSEFTTAPTSNARTFSNANNMGTIAIDLSNNVWASDNRDTTPGSDHSAGSIVKVGGSSGANTAASGSPVGYYVGYFPDGFAIDQSDNVYLATDATGIAAGEAVNKFANASGTAFSISDASPNTAPPYKLFGGNTKLAVGQTTGVTGGLAGTTANDGSFLYAMDAGGCVTTPVTAGVLYQFATGDFLPTANSVYATSVGATSPATNPCPTTNKVAKTFSAATSNPSSMALDKNDAIWLTDDISGTTTGSFDGLTYLVPNATTGVIDPTYGSVSFVQGTETTPPSSTYGASTYGLKLPYGLSIDGANNAWVANQGITQVTELTATLGTATTNPTIALTALPAGPSAARHVMSSPNWTAVDPSGNVWIPNYGQLAQTLPVAGSNVSSTVTILVGIAAPVVTPLAEAVSAKRVGQTP